MAVKKPRPFLRDKQQKKEKYSSRSKQPEAADAAALGSQRRHLPQPVAVVTPSRRKRRNRR